VSCYVKVPVIHVDNPHQNKRSSVPRHNEIVDQLARKICKDLGIQPMK